MKAQDLVKKENIHQVHPYPKTRVRNPFPGPLKAQVAQHRRSFGLEPNEEGSDHECTGYSCQEE
eukprot:1762761-Prorocentrum_lima.AAC.1